MGRATGERVRELLNYDPDSGLFTWRANRSNQVKAGDIAGTLNPNGYVQIFIDGKGHPAHRLAFLVMNGEYPPNDTDHINNVKSDNRWVNLRLATRSQNMANKLNKATNTSGKKGVYLRRGKWCARIQFDGKRYHLGFHATKETAWDFYVGAARLIFGEFANDGER